ncbi:Type I restriction-modification system, specificity subunit S [Lactobacillus delbrueckii subsp. lactis]|nr:Type I restriction-modification system, specificity subunit S [Lactobacillus delbrueckii subsp. lactis]
MKDEKKAPKLRFKGFTDDWEQCKLGDVADRVTRKNKGMVSELPLTISAQDGLISQDEFFNKKVASKDLSSYLLLHHGDFAYNKSYSNGYPFGTIKRLEKYPQGVVSSLYIAFKPNSSISSDFMAQYYESNNWHKEIYKCAAEGARNHGLLNVPPSDFFATNLNIPITKSEQLKIGRLLNAVDQTITLHEEKKRQLECLKSALLQKMFADENGYPAVRFRGFDEAWKQCKLGDVGQTYTGLSGKSKEDFGHGKARFVTYMNIYSNPVSDLNMVEPIEIDERQNEVQYGDAFFTTSSETPEEVGMASVWTGDEKHTYLNSFCFGYRPISKINPYYLAYMLNSQSLRRKIVILAQGISRYNISKKSVMEIPASLPSAEEQNRIGLIFKDLDQSITLYEHKLELLKRLKSSLLQNMFI